jgi:hypothetical protein
MRPAARTETSRRTGMPAAAACFDLLPARSSDELAATANGDGHGAVATRDPELFSSERTLSSEGAGHNLVEAIVMLAHSIDRAAAAIEQFNEER